MGAQSISKNFTEKSVDNAIIKLADLTRQNEKYDLGYKICNKDILLLTYYKKLLNRIENIFEYDDCFFSNIGKITLKYQLPTNKECGLE